MKRYTVLLCLLFSLLILPTKANENPFLKRNPIHQSSVNPTTPPPNSQPASEDTNEFSTPIKSWFQGIQYQLNQELAIRTRQAKNGSLPQAWLILMLLAFAYGAFHSLGPGHGKCVICSYFIAEKASIRQGLILGYLVAIIHAFSALLIVSVLYFLLKRSGGILLENATRLTGLVGYGLVVLMGFYLLFRTLKSSAPQPTLEEAACHHEHDHKHEHEHCDHEHEHQPVSQKTGFRQLLTLALAIGMVPCPGALTILLFSISLDFLQLGIVLAAMIALGMGITSTMMAIGTIWMRQGSLHWFRSSKIPFSIEKILRISGACLTLFFGGLFFILNL